MVYSLKKYTYVVLNNTKDGEKKRSSWRSIDRWKKNDQKVKSSIKIWSYGKSYNDVIADNAEYRSPPCCGPHLETLAL